MSDEEAIRAELVAYLKGGTAHAPLIEAAKSVPARFMNFRPKNLPYTLWALFEHLRLTQRDMLDFIRDPDYQEKDWPGDYWPPPEMKATPKMWNQTLAGYREDLKALNNIVADTSVSLVAPIAWGEGQIVLREILQAMDHASYHTGQFVLMMQLAGVWTE